MKKRTICQKNKKKQKKKRQRPKIARNIQLNFGRYFESCKDFCLVSRRYCEFIPHKHSQDQKQQLRLVLKPTPERMAWRQQAWFHANITNSALFHYT